MPFYVFLSNQKILCSEKSGSKQRNAPFDLAPIMAYQYRDCGIENIASGRRALHSLSSILPVLPAYSTDDSWVVYSPKSEEGT
jgi:hypothetical protein